MKQCPNPECLEKVHFGVSGEYRDDIELCPDCGTALVYPSAPTTEEAHSEDDDVEYVLGGRISNAAVTPVAKSLLDSAGIRYYVRNELEQEYFGRVGMLFNSAVGPVEFWVDAEALEEAREVLDELEDS